MSKGKPENLIKNFKKYEKNNINKDNGKKNININQIIDNKIEKK